MAGEQCPDLTIGAAGARPRGRTVAAPLTRLVATIAAPGTCATARLVVRDGRGDSYAALEVALSEGRGGAEWVVRGELGRHRAELWLAGERCLWREFLVDAETAIHTGDPRWDMLYPRLRAFVDNDMEACYTDGRLLRGCACAGSVWIRDHTHMLQATRYWERDPVGFVDHFLEHQRADGSFFDFTRQFTDPERLAAESRSYGLQPDLALVDHDNLVLYKRIGVEADLEYLLVQAVYLVWQATGDDAWMAAALPRLERGLRYAMTDPFRWSPEHQLVKRPFTIDSWDFEVGLRPVGPDGEKLNSRCEVDGDTHWCLMHGDNSGMAQACELLGRMYHQSGDLTAADRWSGEAAGFRERLNRWCWNGRFYTHQVHLDAVEPLGVDEAAQLSLSVPLAITRRVADHAQAVSIIAEYQRRRETTEAFAEWFSLDPPFPAEAFDGTWHSEPGQYVNGGILPMVGGELARGAFAHGQEDYAVDILQRYRAIIAETQQTCFAYHRSGHRDERVTFPNNGWGPATMIGALIEGLVGVVDEASLLRTVTISPRWPAAGQREVSCVVRYGAVDAYVAYRASYTAGSIHLTYAGTAQAVTWRVLLPEPATATAVVAPDGPVPWSEQLVEVSRYVVFETTPPAAELTVHLTRRAE